MKCLFKIVYSIYLYLIERNVNKQLARFVEQVEILIILNIYHMFDEAAN